MIFIWAVPIFHSLLSFQALTHSKTSFAVHKSALKRKPLSLVCRAQMILMKVHSWIIAFLNVLCKGLGSSEICSSSLLYLHQRVGDFIVDVRRARCWVVAPVETEGHGFVSSLLRHTGFLAFAGNTQVRYF